jgi:hypothetical protein
MEIGQNKATPKNLQGTDFQLEQRSISSKPLLVKMVLDVENARSPLQAGIALRALDGLTGGRATTNLLFENNNLSGDQNYITLIENHASGTVGTTPLVPIPGTIVDGASLQGFPEPPPLAAGDGLAASDGSGEHGIRNPTFTDALQKTALYGLATGAEGRGLSFAADNLRHYLGNSGDIKEFDPSAMWADVPVVAGGIQATYNNQILDVATREILRTYSGGSMEFQIISKWNITEEFSYSGDPKLENWFYSIGQASYNFNATVSVSQNQNGQTEVRIDTQLNMFDRYNWDVGKLVEVMGVTIYDEQMGKLHEAGIAK